MGGVLHEKGRWSTLARLGVAIGLVDRNLHEFGRAALLRRPRIQGRAAALPYQEVNVLFKRRRD
jgi:hypothetical protein